MNLEKEKLDILFKYCSKNGIIKISLGESIMCAMDDYAKYYHEAKLKEHQPTKTEAFNIPDVSPRLFYVVARSHTEEGNWEQISNGFEDYSNAVKYRDGSFCKGRWPGAFIVASLNEG